MTLTFILVTFVHMDKLGVWGELLPMTKLAGHQNAEKLLVICSCFVEIFLVALRPGMFYI